MQIIPQHPGYYWAQDQQGRWDLRWEPVQGYYSPPKFDLHLQQYLLLVPDDFLAEMGFVIGRLGKHFKRITEVSGTKYIFFRSDSRNIEIWGACSESIQYAVSLLEEHYNLLRKKRHY